jgi:membrane associated rhomboid family serine protease
MAIIIANLILYLAVLFSSTQAYPFGPFGQVMSDRFTYYLGLIPYYFTSRPWTLLTAMFIHGGFWHIFGNMITLFFFGSFLNRLIGSGRFLLVYFLGGIFGNVLCVLLGQDLSLFIGASGAIYAIAGALVVMMPRLQVRLYFLIPVPLWVVVIVFFGIWSIPGLFSNIAWQAHLGGLVVGLIAGYFLRRKIRYDFYR